MILSKICEKSEKRLDFLAQMRYNKTDMKLTSVMDYNLEETVNGYSRRF